MNDAAKIAKGPPCANGAGDPDTLGGLVQIMWEEGEQEDSLFQA